jgi:hypothetical protein
MARGSIRNNTVLPSTTIAKQISQIQQARSKLKLANFQQPTRTLPIVTVAEGSPGNLVDPPPLIPIKTLGVPQREQSGWSAA